MLKTIIDSNTEKFQTRLFKPNCDFIGGSLTILIFAVVFSPIFLSPEYPIPIKAYVEEIFNFLKEDPTPESSKINLITEDGKRYEVNVHFLFDHTAISSKSSNPQKFY